MTKEIVINGCYGGFSISPKALQLYAKKTGRECYFFKQEYISVELESSYYQITLEEAEDCFIPYAFDIENPDFTQIECNDYWEKHYIDNRDISRDDPILIEIIKELGEDANGICAELSIVEIPDDVMEWTIEEYDGREWVAETHRTWS